MTGFIVSRAVTWIDVSGYTGLAVLMALESMVAPLPGKVVMPFAAFHLKSRRNEVTHDKGRGKTADRVVASILPVVPDYFIYRHLERAKDKRGA